jgi:hypothetical protein
VAVIAQALVFGLAHGYQGWKAVIVISVLGVMYGLLAAWRRNLRANIMAHAVIRHLERLAKVRSLEVESHRPRQQSAALCGDSHACTRRMDRCPLFHLPTLRSRLRTQKSYPEVVRIESSPAEPPVGGTWTVKLIGGSRNP